MASNLKRPPAWLLAMGLALSLIPGVAVPSAQAATQTVTITPSGYVPNTITITTGDTVTWVNATTAAREIDLKQTTGFTCTVTPLVIQPTAQQSCTFTTAGSYTFTDPKDNGPSFRGTITVNPAVTPSVTLTSTSTLVRYGSTITLSGTVVPGGAGTAVEILALEYGQTTPTRIATVTTASTGAFSLGVAPRIRTVYRAQFATSGKTYTSPDVLVQVRPRVILNLRYIKRGYAYFRTAAVSALDYAGVRVWVQRRTSTGTWSTLKVVRLGAESSARFRVRVPSVSSRIRVLLPAASAGPGYLAGWSRGILLPR